MTLLNAGLQLFAILILLLSGRLVTDRPAPGEWSVTESIDVLPTLHCSFTLRHGEFGGACSRDSTDER